MKRTALVISLLVLLLPGCDRQGPGNEINVSVLGGPVRLRSPAEQPQGADAALLGAIGQGLVRFDAGAEIEPGVAMRWARSDDGLYYTFRLARELAEAEPTARRLRRLVRDQRGRNHGDTLDAIREIRAVTPEVIEIRLSSQRPELMALLASPSFALLHNGRGTGPLEIAADGRRSKILALKADETNKHSGESASRHSKRRIVLRGERPALAVARFASGQAALITGGDFVDAPYPRLAGIAPANILADPATGLFGFRISRRAVPLMTVEIRQALSMALDRDAIGDALGAPGWRSSHAILPPGLTDIAQPTRPFWARAIANVRGASGQAVAQRVAEARRIVAGWCRVHNCNGRLSLTVAMPDGIGAALLFAALRRQWRAIGVDIERAHPGASADLSLIDEVAPADQADWYLAHFLCARGGPCSEEADRAYLAARAEADPTARARLIAEAERRLAAIAPFIPLAQPVRWSLAVRELEGFRPNARAIHPLAPLIRNQNTG